MCRLGCATDGPICVGKCEDERWANSNSADAKQHLTARVPGGAGRAPRGIWPQPTGIRGAPWDSAIELFPLDDVGGQSQPRLHRTHSRAGGHRSAEIAAPAGLPHGRTPGGHQGYSDGKMSRFKDLTVTILQRPIYWTSGLVYVPRRFSRWTRKPTYHVTSPQTPGDRSFCSE